MIKVKINSIITFILYHTILQESSIIVESRKYNLERYAVVLYIEFRVRCLLKELSFSEKFGSSK